MRAALLMRSWILIVLNAGIHLLRISDIEAVRGGRRVTLGRTSKAGVFVAVVRRKPRHLPGPHLAQTRVGKRFLRNLELRCLSSHARSGSSILMRYRLHGQRLSKTIKFSHAR